MLTPLALTFDSGRPGPALLVLGGVRGDSPCGPAAIDAFAEDVATGYFRLVRGKITLVPVCNPAAFARGVPSVGAGLDRAFALPEDDAEGAAADALKLLVARSDYVLDVRSAPSSRASFAFPADVRSAAFARSLGASRVAAPRPLASGPAAFAASLGKVAVEMECGKNGSAASVSAAFAALRGALAFLGIARNAFAFRPPGPRP